MTARVYYSPLKTRASSQPAVLAAVTPERVAGKAADRERHRRAWPN
jgi:hypothetical protein